MSADHASQATPAAEPAITRKDGDGDGALDGARSRLETSAGPGDAPPASGGLGQFPLIALFVATGLLICALTDTLSRATESPSALLYWAGILLIAVPVFFRLVSPDPSPGERLALVGLFAMALYGVKIARDPLLFTFPDEFIHAYNADQVVEHDRLFGNNPVLPVTPSYPGLSGATSALMSMTGMSHLAAGMLLIGAARLTLVCGLFVLFRRLSGDPRTAGLGAVIYAGNSNFLLWGAQYSYASLAIPLFVFVLMSLVEREGTTGERLRAWVLPIVLATFAIVVTHHLTSYALAAILVALAVLYYFLGKGWRPPNPWRFALLAVGLSLTWLAVASRTAGYLSPVISRAFESTWDTITGEAGGRALFSSGDSNIALGSTPIGAKITAIAAIGILAVALPFGLRRVWRGRDTHPLVLLFCLASVTFFAVLGLRFAPAAWETANRLGEYMFIGLAFVTASAALVAYTWLDGRGPRSAPWAGRALLSACFGVVIVGGAIAGWPWDAHIAKPVRGTIEGREVRSEPLGLAQWVRGNLPDGRFAANNADARLLLVPGGAWVRSGRHPDIEDIISESAFTKEDCRVNCVTTPFQSWMLPLLNRLDLRYVVADRRFRGADIIRGYSFSLRPEGGEPDQLLPKEAVLKFEQIPAATRVFDSGNIVVYDIKGRE